MDIQMLSSAFDLAFAPSVLLLVVIGVFWGTLIGALPGLGSIIAITMILPFTYKLSSVGALSLIMGVYCGAVYGGCISAILLNTPGTPQSAATCFDGFPMAKQGKAGEAIGWATISSTIGGLFSCVVLVLVGPKLASFAQNFGPIETFALIVMALTCISGVSQGSIFKGLMAGCIGLFLGVIGSDPMSGNLRFTFGNFQLNGGVNLIAVVIGVFSLTEVLFRAFEGNEDGSNLVLYNGMRFPKMAQWKGRVGTLIKSCLIGTGVGILPGTGGATASFISYAEAKRSSPFRDNFGKGEPAGIIAPESSNNAVTGGALIPTLALGIPGDPVTAVMMVTLVIHGMTPGVRLMRDNPETVMATFVMLFLANLLLIPVGMLISKVFAKILYLPEILLMAGVVLLCTLGVYADSNNYFHLRIALVCGIIGSAMRYLKIPIAPLVIGLVLSNQLEVSLRQGLLLSNNNPMYFLYSPIAVLLFLLAIIILIMPIIQNIKSNRIKSVNKK